MLRTTLNLRNGIDINNYHNLKVFIQNCAKGYHSKKARVLTLSQVNKFLNESDDLNNLANKVILTFGVFGALRTSEICNLSIQDVEDTGNQMIVTINDNKNCYPRNFVVGKEYYNHVKKYISLRPDDFDSRRFFFAYHSGKGKRQIIGKNKISEVPRKVAEYLELEHPEAYTGHCFRRTAATLLANSGANLTAVKQLGGWRSSTVAEGNIENSLANRRQIYQQIISSHQEISSDSTSNCQVSSATITNEAPSTSTANQKNPETNLNVDGMPEEHFLEPDSDDDLFFEAKLDDDFDSNENLSPFAITETDDPVPKSTETTNTSENKSVLRVDSTRRRKLNEIRETACAERLKKLKKFQADSKTSVAKKLKND
ncbi:uncharacterized protein LOC141525706 [Cotesia typhae]|uniref:uncharacterized protein LOC141525706 n=1 Tax=Cotesia typhae TaxID=2053667 RepID=UPI003D691DEE